MDRDHPGLELQYRAPTCLSKASPNRTSTGTVVEGIRVVGYAPDLPQ